VSGLAYRRLIERERIDGRSYGLALTDRGASIAAKAKRTVAIHEEELLARIPITERKAFLAALRKLWRAD
jgi:DNA-binding MarR family transcriptional regulator